MCLVSIIVPVYNVEKYIDKCLNTLVNQTIEDIEIIIVNDGSRDNSQGIIDKYKKLYNDKIISVKKENGGLSDARNYGLKHANGKYVGFVDPDDWVEFDMYEKLCSVADRVEADIVISDFIFEPDNKIIRTNLEKHKVLNLKSNPNLLLIEPSVCNKLFRRKLFSENNISFPVGLLHEDRFTIAKLYFYSKAVYYCGEGYYHYLKQRENSITTSVNMKKFTDILIILGYIDDFFRQHKLYNDIKASIDMLILNSYLSFSIRAISEISNTRERNNYLDEFREFLLLKIDKPNKVIKKIKGWKLKLINFLLIKRCYSVSKFIINLKR